MSTREPAYWAWKESDTLYHTEIEDCVQDFLDDLEEGEQPPETIELTGYARMVPNVELISGMVLDFLLEHLDENFGNPEEYTKPSELMKEASKEFVEEVLKRYTIWMCEPVRKKVVNIKEVMND